MIQLFHGVYNGPEPASSHLLAAFEGPEHAESYRRQMERAAQTCNPAITIRYSIGPVRVRTVRKAPSHADRRCIR